MFTLVCIVHCPTTRREFTLVHCPVCLPLDCGCPATPARANQDWLARSNSTTSLQRTAAYLLDLMYAQLTLQATIAIHIIRRARI